MKRSLLILPSIGLLAAAASAQVSYSQDFNASIASWVVSGGFSPGWYSGANACGGSGGVLKTNLYSGATSSTYTSPLLGSSLGGSTTITFDYKIVDYSTYAAAGTPFGTITVQYGATSSGPWTNAGSLTDEAQTGSCLAKSYTFTPAAGDLYVRFSLARTGGDNWWFVDNVVVSETTGSCSGTPTPGNVTGAPVGGVCSGANFTLGLQNATTGSGVTYQWYSSTTSAGGPWNPLGTSATQSASQVVDSWYYCDVTCSAGPSTGSSAVEFVPMSTPSAVQDWSTGVVTPNCWSISNPVGTYLPAYSTASGYGVGTGSAGFNFYNASNTYELVLTSPTFAAVGAGTDVYFDAAGATYIGGEIDHMLLEESNDGGTTWTLIADLTNEPVNGALNTGGATSSPFVPTAAQWTSLHYPLTAGTNRVRFHGVSNYGNVCYVDNVSIGVPPSARNTTYGGGCDGYTMSAAPAPVTGNTVIFNQVGIPEAAPASGVYFGVVVNSLSQLNPGIPLNVLTGGAIDSPCSLLLGSLDLLVSFVSATSTDSTVTLPIPLGAPIGAEVFTQGFALIVPVAPNNAGIVTSNAVRSYINTF